MDSEATKAQRWTWCMSGHYRDETGGDFVKHHDHAAKVAELERAVEVLARESAEAKAVITGNVDIHTHLMNVCWPQVHAYNTATNATDSNPIAKAAIEKARNESGLGRGATT